MTHFRPFLGGFADELTKVARGSTAFRDSMKPVTIAYHKPAGETGYRPPAPVAKAAPTPEPAATGGGGKGRRSKPAGEYQEPWAPLKSKLVAGPPPGKPAPVVKPVENPAKYKVNPDGTSTHSAGTRITKGLTPGQNSDQVYRNAANFGDTNAGTGRRSSTIDGPLS